MAVTTIVEEPMLSRLDRLDTIVRQLEEIRGGNRSPKSSCASTPSSCTLNSDGQISSIDFSPRSLEKHCRPIDDVMIETGVKGTLIERLVHVEDRVAKLEEEIEAQKRRVLRQEEEEKKREMMLKTKKKKKGFKKLMASCVGSSNSKQT